MDKLIEQINTRFIYVKWLEYSPEFHTLYDVVKHQKWNCHAKSLLLIQLLKEIDIDCVMSAIFYELPKFKWLSVNINYDIHYFVEFNYFWKNISLDCAYDWNLKHEFIHLEQWNMIDSMRLSHKPVKRFWDIYNNKEFHKEKSIWLKEFEKISSSELDLFKNKMDEFFHSMRADKNRVDSLDLISVRLSAQRALLDTITPSMRAIAVGIEGNRLTLRAIFDGEPSEDEKELIRDAGGEIMADFPWDAFISEEFVRVDAPADFRSLLLDHPVYIRYEPLP